MNVKIIFDDVENKITSTTATGYLLYSTHLLPILSLAAVPEPLTYLAADHNFNLGTNRLHFVPTTGFGRVTLTELLATSAHNAAVAQLQRIVNAWGANGGGAVLFAHAAVAPAPAQPTGGLVVEPVNILEN